MELPAASKKKRKGGGKMLPTKPKGDLTLMPKILAASIQAWKDKHNAGDLQGQPFTLLLRVESQACNRQPVNFRLFRVLQTNRTF
jgi:hypothetical protein